MARRRRELLLSAAEHRRRHLLGLPFKAAADDEVRAFVDGALLNMTFRQAADAARARFGRSRAPSRSALYRYWAAVRAAKQ